MLSGTLNRAICRNCNVQLVLAPLILEHITCGLEVGEDTPQISSRWKKSYSLVFGASGMTMYSPMMGDGKTFPTVVTPRKLLAVHIILLRTKFCLSLGLAEASQMVSRLNANLLLDLDLHSKGRQSSSLLDLAVSKATLARSDVYQWALILRRLSELPLQHRGARLARIVHKEAEQRRERYCKASCWKVLKVSIGAFDRMVVINGACGDGDEFIFAKFDKSSG
jgi:hypothetical protein